MNYEEMSDFEVNMRVACSIDGVSVDESGNPEYAIDCFLHSDNGISVKWLRCGNDEFEFFNPCNNPSDAWPIIFSSRIMLNPYCADELWKAEVPCGFDGFFKTYATCYHRNPLRAAMVVFLMMQGKAK